MTHLTKMNRLRVMVAICLASLAVSCGGEMTTPQLATPAHGLLVTVAVPGKCLVGGCDPANSEQDRLGLVTLTNTGSAFVFVPICGTLPAIQEQQFVNGQWVNVGPAVSCAFGPLSRSIAPRDSLQMNVFFGAGTWRMTVGAAVDSLLATEMVSASAAVDVK